MTHHNMPNQKVTESETKDGIQQAKDAAKQAVDQVQHKAQEVAHQAQDQAKSAVAARKDQAAEQLGSVAQAIRSTSGELRSHEQDTVAQYVDKVADQVERISGYLGERDVDQLLEDAESMARRQPELFLGGAFVIGLLIGRFIKSSSERRLAQRYQNYGYPENYTGETPGYNRPGSNYGTYQGNVSQGYSSTYQGGTTPTGQSPYSGTSTSDLGSDVSSTEPRKW